MNPFSPSALVEPVASAASSDSFDQTSLETRSQALASEPYYINTQLRHPNPLHVHARKCDHANIHSCLDTRQNYHQMPLVTATTAGGRTSTTYTPFSLQDTSMIKSKLPDINKGGAWWIKAFLEACAGVVPAVGDFRRVFASCTSLGMLTEIEQRCGTDLDADSTPLHQVVHQLWPMVREKFPIQMKSAELC